MKTLRKICKGSESKFKVVGDMLKSTESSNNKEYKEAWKTVSDFVDSFAYIGNGEGEVDAKDIPKIKEELYEEVLIDYEDDDPNLVTSDDLNEINGATGVIEKYEKDENSKTQADEIKNETNSKFYGDPKYDLESKYVTENEDGTIDYERSINLHGLNLTNIPFNFNKVIGNFYCTNNELTSLKGAPKEVGGDFKCYNNELTSLKGGPISVGESFICNLNKLTSLKGAPKEVGGDFMCTFNKLTSLEGAPKEVGGNFKCNNNAKQFTEDDISEVSNVEGNIYIENVKYAYYTGE